MTEQAGIEEEDYAINLNFEGHPPEEVVLQQLALGYHPTLLVNVRKGDDEVDFDIDVYGIEDIRGFLDTIVVVLQNILERPLEFPEASVPDEEYENDYGE